jgi:hypothetical protein
MFEVFQSFKAAKGQCAVLQASKSESNEARAWARRILATDPLLKTGLQFLSSCDFRQKMRNQPTGSATGSRLNAALRASQAFISDWLGESSFTGRSPI